MKSSLRWGAIGLAAWMAAGTAQAVLLSDLLQGGSITIGDKVFADFTYTTACGPAANTIEVIPWDFGYGKTGYRTYGICIQGPMVATGAVPPGPPVCDIGLTYTVSVLPGSPWWIHDLYQSLVPTVVGNGGTIGIGELARLETSTGMVLGTSNVGFVGTSSDLEDPPGEIGDTLVFSSPAKRVFVAKDIYLEAADPNSLVGATLIYQGFSQIPECGDFALIGALGLLGFGLWRRR